MFRTQQIKNIPWNERWLHWKIFYQKDVNYEWTIDHWFTHLSRSYPNIAHMHVPFSCLSISRRHLIFFLLIEGEDRFEFDSHTFSFFAIVLKLNYFNNCIATSHLLNFLFFVFYFLEFLFHDGTLCKKRCHSPHSFMLRIFSVENGNQIRLRLYRKSTLNFWYCVI